MSAQPMITVIVHCPADDCVMEMMEESGLLESDLDEVLVFQLTDNRFIAPEREHLITYAHEHGFKPRLLLIPSEHMERDWTEVRPEEDAFFNEVMSGTFRERFQVMYDLQNLNRGEMVSFDFAEVDLRVWDPR